MTPYFGRMLTPTLSGEVPQYDLGKIGSDPSVRESLQKKESVRTSGNLPSSIKDKRFSGNSDLGMIITAQ